MSDGAAFTRDEEIAHAEDILAEFGVVRPETGWTDQELAAEVARQGWEHIFEGSTGQWTVTVRRHSPFGYSDAVSDDEDRTMAFLMALAIALDCDRATAKPKR